MRYLLFASHGRLAEGILDSVEMITGKHDNIFTICAYKNENEELSNQLESALLRITDEDELIIVTDIFGGSVNNECLKLVNNKRIHLIAGLNLALVIELVTRIKSKMDTVELINSSIEISRESTIYCNNVLQNDVDDEDF